MPGCTKSVHRHTENFLAVLHYTCRIRHCNRDVDGANMKQHKSLKERHVTKTHVHQVEH